MKRSVQSLRCDLIASSLGLRWLERITVRRSVTGSACYWHSHDEHEVIFLIDGSVTYVFRNRKDVRLRGGQFLVIPKGLAHRMPDGIDTPSFRLGFNLSADPKVRPTPFSDGERREMLGALLTARLAPRPLPSSTRDDLIEIAKLVAAQNSGTPLGPLDTARLKLLASLVVAECAGAIGGPRAADRANGEEIDAAIAFIDRHAEEPFDLKALIAYMGYSRSRLFELFRQKTGLSPAAYHQRQRLARAQELLNTTRLTSEQISERLGFDSPAYFTYAFRRCCGVTPIAYREMGTRDDGS